MANSYLKFSEVIPRLNAEEEAWLREQLQVVYVFDGVEYAEENLPGDLDPENADYYGCRAWRDFPGYDPECGEPVGFGYRFDTDDYHYPEHPDLRWKCHLWIHAEEFGDPERAAHLVQKFLRRFRPEDCWALSFAIWCSKPRPREFGGGAVVVTAEAILYTDSWDFIRKRAGSCDRQAETRSYSLRIGEHLLQEQCRLLGRLCDPRQAGQEISLDERERELIEGVCDLLDEIADQARDHCGTDRLERPAEVPGDAKPDDRA